MAKVYLRALVSAASEKEAWGIVRRLTEKRLIAGALVTEGLSRYRWKGRVVEKNYFNVSAFTTTARKNEIIRDVESVHRDEIPIVAFFKIEHANEKFLRWIDENTA